jgi:flavin reductase (DIM6/NTAB) family NADH-FMN oxidoreductase RutF
MNRPADDIVGPIPEGREADAYDKLRRRVLWSLPSGLYVVGSRAAERRNLMTLSWLSQVALVPKLIGIGVETSARTHQLIVDGGVFAISLVARGDRALVRHFVKPVPEENIDVDPGSGRGTMNGTPVHSAVTGAPILDAAPAWFDCEVRHALPVGSHTWFVGEVVDVGMDDDTGVPSSAGGNDEGGVLRMEDTRMNYGG